MQIFTHCLWTSSAQCVCGSETFGSTFDYIIINYSKSAPTSTSTKFRLEIPYDIGATQIQYGFITDLADVHIVYDQFDHNGSQLQLTGSFSIPQHYI